MLKSTQLEFIDTSIENGSPLWYDVAEGGAVRVHLMYDHERASANRAAGHFHFLVHARPGSELILEFLNLENIYNGRPGSVARELKIAFISEEGSRWRAVPLQALSPGRVRLTLKMAGSQIFVARLEPYRLSDLDRLLGSLASSPLVGKEAIGSTVENRPVEIIRVGNPDASRRVFVRARAHPWESGGNWVVEGLLGRLICDDDLARQCLGCYSVYILPMANKDGVAHGRTRFNLRGKDLNRDWDKPADPLLAPENHALERWLQRMIASGKAPQLALELHNDGGGKLHTGKGTGPRFDTFVKRMALLERLLRQHTWFTEGTAQSVSSSTLGDGWLQRYGIDAVVHELHCNWIAGLKDYPSAKHWMDYGAKLATVFQEYFKSSAY